MIKLAAATPRIDIARHAHMRHDQLKRKIHAAESESDVRQSVLALYDLDLIGNLEKNRIDFWSDELLMEMKYDADFLKLNSKCKVLSQLLHYLYNMPTKHSNFNLPENLALVDKNHIVLYRTDDFLPYLFKDEYFREAARPSAEHPLLEKALRLDRNTSGVTYNTIADYPRVWDEFEKRGIYD